MTEPPPRCRHSRYVTAQKSARARLTATYQEYTSPCQHMAATRCTHISCCIFDAVHASIILQPHRADGGEHVHALAVIRASGKAAAGYGALKLVRGAVDAWQHRQHEYTSASSQLTSLNRSLRRNKTRHDVPSGLKAPCYGTTRAGSSACIRRR